MSTTPRGRLSIVVYSSWANQQTDPIRFSLSSCPSYSSSLQRTSSSLPPLTTTSSCSFIYSSVVKPGISSSEPSRVLRASCPSPFALQFQLRAIQNLAAKAVVSIVTSLLISAFAFDYIYSISLNTHRATTIMPSKPSPIEILLASVMHKQLPIHPGDHGKELEQGQDLSKVANTILDKLDKADLLALRATSTTVKACVEADPSRYHEQVFGELTYHGNVKNEESQQKLLDTVSQIAPYCKHLRIYLYDTSTTFATPRLSLVGVADSFWMRLFALLSLSLASLAISAPGINGWDWLAYGAIERQVGSLRVAMERQLVRGLDMLELDPINAGALLYLRWRGASIVSACAQAEVFWSSLDVLRIKMFNPLGHLSPANSVDFLKTLHDFLGSFRRSLRGLEFEWLGPQGPNPLFLDMLTGFEGLYAASPFQWSALTHARLVNVEGEEQVDFAVLRLYRASRLQVLVVRGGGGRLRSPAPPSVGSVVSASSSISSSMESSIFELE